MITDRIEIRAEKPLYRNRIDLLLLAHGFSSGGGETLSVGRSVAFELLPEDHVFGEPTVSLQMREAQMLMDELWRCGLRPSEGTGSAGSLAATQAHLKDMQTIAFQLLNRPTQIYSPEGLAQLREIRP